MTTETTPAVKVALCIDTKDFAWAGNPIMCGNAMIPIGEGAIEEMEPRLIDRAICETDESTLQLLPYNVLINEEGKVFCYSRGGAGAEGRLHGKLSVGIGGHVDVAPALSWSSYTLLASEAIREIHEEVGLSWGNMALPRFTHYLIDYTNAVGRVHLGLLSINHVHTSQIGKLEDGMIENGEFVDIDFLCEVEQYPRLENWSQSVVSYLRREKHRGSKVDGMVYAPPR